MKFDIILANTSQTGFNPIWLIIIIGIVIIIAAAIVSNSRSEKLERQAKIEAVNQFPNHLIENRLAKLEELRSKNLINQEEYEAQRLKILDEL